MKILSMLLFSSCLIFSSSNAMLRALARVPLRSNLTTNLLIRGAVHQNPVRFFRFWRKKLAPSVKTKKEQLAALQKQLTQMQEELKKMDAGKAESKAVVPHRSHPDSLMAAMIGFTVGSNLHTNQNMHHATPSNHHQVQELENKVKELEQKLAEEADALKQIEMTLVDQPATDNSSNTADDSSNNSWFGGWFDSGSGDSGSSWGSSDSGSGSSGSGSSDY